jgi:chloramphenicol 3-O-phosphotransferase
VPGNWDATIVLLSGASTMGKSHYARAILEPEYSAVCVRIDDLYTSAVTHANLVKSSKGQTMSEQQRNARRYARDRKWPNPEAKDTFFAFYEDELRKAMENGRNAHVAVVLEGGTLMKDDEIAVIAKCADDIFGKAARLVRITVKVPYKRWLQNRVARMVKAKMENAPIRKLTENAYKTEVKRAIPRPNARLVDHSVQSPKEIRALMAQFNRAGEG